MKEVRSRSHTYDKRLRAASPALCGRSGAALIRQGARVTGFILLGPKELERSNLLQSIKQLHPAIGVVLRDYGGNDAQAAVKVLALCRYQRRLVLRAGAGNSISTPRPRHIPRWQPANRRSAGLRSYSVHTVPEAIRARRARADLVFISPVFQTSSHPGERPIGLFEARRLARAARGASFALGGITPERRKAVAACGHFQGVGAISALLEG